MAEFKAGKFRGRKISAEKEDMREYIKWVLSLTKYNNVATYSLKTNFDFDHAEDDIPRHWSKHIHGDKETVHACTEALADYYKAQEQARERSAKREAEFAHENATLTDDEKKAIVARLQAEYDAVGGGGIDNALSWGMYYLNEQNGHKPVSVWLEGIMQNTCTRRAVLEQYGFKFYKS